MSDTLALVYRPQNFDEVVGQKHIKPILREMVRSGRMPAALLFSGTRGTGKTTTARIVAKALNCDSEKPPCGECPSCLAVKNGNSLDVLEIDAASNGGVAEIRKIKDMVAYSVGGRWRVILLDECHSMSKDANNALLKVLEEPPENTLFILLTTEPGKILDTVVSRTMHFEFRRITISEIVDRLRLIAQQEAINVQDELLVEIATRAQGGMRDAIMLLDQVSRIGVSDVIGFRDLFGIRNVSVELLIAALESNHAHGGKVIEEYFYRVGDAQGMVNDLVLLVRDLLVLRSGGDPIVTNTVELAERTQLASRISTDRLVTVVKVLWDLKNRVRAIDNDQRAAMEMAFVLISEALSPSVTTAAPVNGNGAPKLSLDAMKQLATVRR